MTTELTLHLVLKSDAAFGRGDGVAGIVDAEVQHDEYGFPYIGGRTLKGLLVEECANLVYSLSRMEKDDAWLESWIEAANLLFGTPGSGVDGFACLRVGPALLPETLRAVAIHEYAGKSPDDMRATILPSLTAIRRQTAVDPVTGAPKRETLRTVRVILRETCFHASLAVDSPPGAEGVIHEHMLGLLAATVLAFRRGGSERNRGRGTLTARLLDKEGNDVSDHYSQLYFAEEVRA